MRLHTSEYKNAICALGRQQEAKITYTIDDIEHVLSNEELNSISYAYDGSLLKSIMQEVKINSRYEIPINTIINLKHGILVNGEYEYLDFGNFIVYEVNKQEADNSFEIKCYDKMLFAMKDYEKLDIQYPISLKNYLIALCEKIDIELKTKIFKNQSRQITDDIYDGIGYTYRDILDDIAEATGTTIYVKEDKLVLGLPTDTEDTIDEEYLKDVNVNFGKKYGPINSIVLSRSEESDNVYFADEQSIAEHGLCEIKIKNNQIMNFDDRSDYLQGIANNLFGTEFYLNDFTSTGILYYELLDFYNVKIADNTYKCLMLNDEVNITQGIQELIFTDEPETSETDYNTASPTDKKINRTNLIVDKANQKISSLITQIGDRSDKTTSITQDIDTIASNIQDIEDLTKVVKQIKTITINDAYVGEEILELHIYGNNSVFKHLYPRNDLFPSDTLYPMGDSRFRFNNQTENIEFDLGIDEVLRANDETRDELLIDNSIVTLIRRVNKDGTTKRQEERTHLGELHFVMQEGDNTFTIVNYNAPMEIKYVTKNTLTDIFATKIEMNSSIKQTADSINLEVKKKAGKDEIISSINQSAEQIKINADKIDIDGKAVHFKTNINERKGPYTNEDKERIIQIMRGDIFPTTEDFDKYDIDGDGRIDVFDSVRITRAIAQNQGYIDGEGTFEINPYTIKRILGLYNEEIQDYTFLLSLYGAYFNEISIKNSLNLGETSQIGKNFFNFKDDLGEIAMFLDSGLDDVPGQVIYLFNGTGSLNSAIQIGSYSSGISAYNDSKSIIQLDGGGNQTIITEKYVKTPTLIQTSKESSKKNISKYNDNALDKIKNSEIYEYNFKSENDEDKKHIGFVIADEGGDYKTPDEVISSNQEGIDTYTMTSLLWKAVQEQQEIIERLEKQIQEMKGEK